MSASFMTLRYDAPARRSNRSKRRNKTTKIVTNELSNKSGDNNINHSKSVDINHVQHHRTPLRLNCWDEPGKQAVTDPSRRLVYLLAGYIRKMQQILYSQNPGFESTMTIPLAIDQLCHLYSKTDPRHIFIWTDKHFYSLDISTINNQSSFKQIASRAHTLGIRGDAYCYIPNILSTYPFLEEHIEDPFPSLSKIDLNTPQKSTTKAKYGAIMHWTTGHYTTMARFHLFDPYKPSKAVANIEVDIEIDVTPDQLLYCDHYGVLSADCNIISSHLKIGKLIWNKYASCMEYVDQFLGIDIGTNNYKLHYLRDIRSIFCFTALHDCYLYDLIADDFGYNVKQVRSWSSEESDDELPGLIPCERIGFCDHKGLNGVYLISEGSEISKYDAIKDNWFNICRGIEIDNDGNDMNWICNPYFWCYDEMPDIIYCMNFAQRNCMECMYFDIRTNDRNINMRIKKRLISMVRNICQRRRRQKL